MKVQIFHATAGHGHKKVAEILAEEFKKKSNPVEVHDSLVFTPFWFRIPYPAIYYYSVKYTPGSWGWFYEAFDLKHIYPWVHPIRTFFNRLAGKKILQKVIQEKPDVLITTHFFTAELFGRAKKEGKINSKIVTVITDYFPHTFWVHPGVDIYWVMAEETKQDLINRGVDPQKVIVGGIPIDPIFAPQGKKEEVLKKWGFSSERLTLLITSGSFGLGPQKEILKALAPFKEKIQCFVVCGNNQAMQKDLEQESFPFPAQIFGFVDFMPDLMEATEVMIAKPGGATATESLAKEIPMVVLDPIPGQETRNATLLKARNAAFFLQDPGQISLILKALLDYPETLAMKRREIKRLAKPEAALDCIRYILEGKTP